MTKFPLFSSISKFVTEYFKHLIMRGKKESQNYLIFDDFILTTRYKKEQQEMGILSTYSVGNVNQKETFHKCVWIQTKLHYLPALLCCERKYSC